jgi:hypothetical protein
MALGLLMGKQGWFCGLVGVGWVVTHSATFVSFGGLSISNRQGGKVDGSHLAWYMGISKWLISGWLGIGKRGDRGEVLGIYTLVAA